MQVYIKGIFLEGAEVHLNPRILEIIINEY